MVMIKMELKWVWFIRLVIAVMSVFWVLGDACLESERIALLQLKSFFNLHNELSDWDEGKGLDCCKWVGIECNSNSRRVIGLYLNNTRWEDRIRREELEESWYLNASMFLPFVELKTLSLQRNAIAGCSENEGFTKLSSTLNNLEFLDLSENRLNDSIMPSLSELSSLRYLSLADNQLHRSSHLNDKTQLRLTKLEELDLSFNLFRNNTISFLKGFSSLKSLNMRGNRLQGSLDLKELNHLTNLKRLDLSDNQIESLLSYKDETQLRLAKLEELDLSYNLFRNNTFSFLKELSSLKSLIMSGNRLQGSLDLKGLSHLTKLKKLDLSWNQIESLESFKDAGNKVKWLTHLEELYLDGNFFNTSVFASLKGLSNLKILSISYNQLEGSLDTKDLEVFANLMELDLSGNQLKDFVIHKGLCDLSKLEVLDLSWNGFEGMLPHCLSNLTYLRELYISGNQFSGNLTPLTNLTALRAIFLSRNHFQVPTSFEPFVNLPNLKFLSIDENKMVMEPSFPTLLPKFQLKVISMRKCTTSQELGLEFFTFLYHQYDLRSVDLSGNNFSGTFPTWLLKNNTKLKYLIFRDNSLSGTLSLPSAPNVNLSFMDISDNRLQGQISSNICSTFPHLRHLFLSKNAFQGNIPTCLSGMKDLEFLDLSNNQLSGSIPKGLIINRSLHILRLSNNKLSGDVAPVILKANGLQRLYLDGNSFSGEIAKIDVSVFEIRTSIIDLDLSNNRLYGKLPTWIGNLSYLEALALSNNSFEGSIPMEFCNLNGLEYLDLSQNNLSGSIPSCFNPRRIQHVHLHGNRLSGPFPLAYYNSSSLVTLDLRGNNLSGRIPKWIGTLSSLSVLLLKDNHFQGTIPLQLCKLYYLNIIDLSQNLFSGHIPSCLGNLTFPMHGKTLAQVMNKIFSEEDKSTIFGSLKLAGDIDDVYPIEYMEEWIEFTTKRGFYSYGGYILDNMTGIDLSCNKLLGEIPPELGNLSQIRCLNLSHNNLVGVIPSSFSKLKQIESLDLSYNNLSGEIPNQLIELNSLAVFSVAHNNLSGSIPEPKAQFGTFDESSYEGNPFLCGPVMLHKSCSRTNPPSTTSEDDDKEDEDAFLDVCVFRVSFLVSYGIMLLTTSLVLYINPHWRRLWFSFVENSITTFRYSALGNFHSYYIFRGCF